MGKLSNVWSWARRKTRSVTIDTIEKVEDWKAARAEAIPGAAPIDPDGTVSLYREKLEGAEMRESVGEPAYPTPSNTSGPVYRNDGQVHNFNAQSYGIGRQLTQKQYDARYIGSRPAPKRNAGQWSQLKDEDE